MKYLREFKIVVGVCHFFKIFKIILNVLLRPSVTFNMTAMCIGRPNRRTIL